MILRAPGERKALERPEMFADCSGHLHQPEARQSKSYKLERHGANLALKNAPTVKGQK